jgi:hypothetical protein
LGYNVDILMSADGAKGLVGIYKIGIQLDLKAAIPCTRFVVGDAIVRFAISRFAITLQPTGRISTLTSSIRSKTTASSNGAIRNIPMTRGAT